jgi:hypothetical protein
MTCDVTNLHPTASMKGWTFALMRPMKPPPNVTLQNYPSSGATAFNEVSLAMVSSTEGNFGMAIYPTSFRIPTVVAVVATTHSLPIGSHILKRVCYTLKIAESIMLTSSADYIPVGGTVAMQFKIKFGAVNDTYKKLGQEAYKAFRDQYPMTLNWPDR